MNFPQIFSDSSAHKAPVRDISLYTASQDTFVSCGYDCHINVYDTRKRSSIVSQHVMPNPLSTISVSACGTYCVVGDLKGEVASLDFRNMGKILHTTRAHDSPVVRVAFISSNVAELNLSSDVTSMETSSPQPNKDGPLSFFQFIDQCGSDHLNFDDDGLCQPADNANDDSWNDLLRSRHQSNDFSMLDSPSSGNISELRLKRSTQGRWSGSPMSGQSSTIPTTPKMMGKSSSGRAESTPLTPKETSNDNKQILDAPSERKVDGSIPIRRRSSFSDEFRSRINPTMMSTPLLRTQSPIKLNRIMHDVIEEESISGLLTTKTDGSQMECKENQQNNYQEPVRVAAPQTDVREPQTQTDWAIGTKPRQISSLKLKDGIVSMTESDYIALIDGMRNDYDKIVEISQKQSRMEFKDFFKKAITDLTEKFQAHNEHIRGVERSHNFAEYFKLRMSLRSIEQGYDKLLNYTPAQLEKELPRLRQLWEQKKAQRDRNELIRQASKY